MNKFMARQGDVMIVAVTQIPADAKLVKRDAGRVVLAYGEQTGHHHSFAGRGIELLEHKGERFLRVAKPSDLTHQEHSTIQVPPGDYHVIQQREYDDTEELRRVQD